MISGTILSKHTDATGNVAIEISITVHSNVRMSKRMLDNIELIRVDLILVLIGRGWGFINTVSGHAVLVVSFFALSVACHGSLSWLLSTHNRIAAGATYVVAAGWLVHFTLGRNSLTAVIVVVAAAAAGSVEMTAAAAVRSCSNVSSDGGGRKPNANSNTCTP